MDYRNLLREENEAVRERLSLSMERIAAMKDNGLAQPYGDFFSRMADFSAMIGRLLDQVESGQELGLSELEARNQALYGDILPGSYETSYANPDYAASRLGEGMGQLLSFLYTEMRGMIVFAFEMRLEEITILNETLIEVCNLFEQAKEEGQEAPRLQQVKDVLYWFVSDYADVTVRWRIREGLDPALSFGKDIIESWDLSDPRYLYQFGEYVSGSELALAAFMGSLPKETVDCMADTYTEGFRRGFQVMGRDLSKKGTVVLEYELGFERMIRRAMENFRAMGLEPVLYRAPVQSINRRPGGKRGYYSSSPNRQYDYDHRYDSAIYMGAGIKERKLSVTRSAYEEFKELAAKMAGPAVVETFGQDGFEPVNKETALSLSAHQQEVSNALMGEIRQVTNQYMPGDETSFTIIAFPRPEIGPDFADIFRETIAINTLDYDRYEAIQQRLIDCLDQAKKVRITGRGGNETCMEVRLHPLRDRARETNFENCVADVNIPLGEVFTSPVLSGTKGLLHVGSVYVDEYQFKNLRLSFEDGRVTDFGCENFKPAPDWEEQGRKLVEQVILRGHNWLPLGEFAIGTNTTAYAMAKRFAIGDKLPILIAEKMGPHFAVGDTCYSFCEDSPMYNPNGKEVIARDNEISILRKEDPSKAYFSCHTDITIPYSELGDIAAVKADGEEVFLIKGGRFVLPGTEELNKALDAGEKENK